MVALEDAGALHQQLAVVAHLHPVARHRPRRPADVRQGDAPDGGATGLDHAPPFDEERLADIDAADPR